MKNITLKNEIPELLQLLISSNKGLEKFKGHSWIIGGYVRDNIMNRESNDIDIVVDIQGGSKVFCNNLKSILGDNVTEPFQLGAYPIWSIRFNTDIIIVDEKEFNVASEVIEIAESQSESFPDNNSRQRITKFGTIEEDILRRDFVINQFRMDLETLKIFEPYHGAIGCFPFGNGPITIETNPSVDTDEILKQDPLRILRALRFFVELDGKLSNDLMRSIFMNRSRLEIISQERILKEIRKVCEVEGGLYKFMKLADELDLIVYIFPEINDQKFVRQGPDIRNIHMEGTSVYSHTMEVLKHTKKGFLNGMISLFHDLGKTNECLEKKPGLKDGDGLDGFRYSQIEHDKNGAILSIDVFRRMKIPLDEAKIITSVIRHHLRLHMIKDGGIRKKPLRKLIRQIGSKEKMELLFNVSKADSWGTFSMRSDGMIVPTFDNGCEIRPIYEEIIVEGDIKKGKSDLFTGNEIMELLDLKEGKIIGSVKEFVKELEDEFGNKLTKEFATKEIAKKFLNKDSND